MRAVSTPKIPIRIQEEDAPVTESDPRQMDAYDGPEQPTVKRANPLQERTTMKMKKAEIDALVVESEERAKGVKESKDASGTRPAVTEEAIANYQRDAEARKKG